MDQMKNITGVDVYSASESSPTKMAKEIHPHPTLNTKPLSLRDSHLFATISNNYEHTIGMEQRDEARVHLSEKKVTKIIEKNQHHNIIVEIWLVTWVRL